MDCKQNAAKTFDSLVAVNARGENREGMKSYHFNPIKMQ